MAQTTDLSKGRRRPAGPSSATVPLKRTQRPAAQAAWANGLGPLGRDSLARALVDASVDCLIVFDLEGRVVEWSPAAERTFGRPRDEVIGAELVELIVPPGQRGREFERLRRLVTDPESGAGYRVERELMRADGEVFPVEVTLTTVSSPEQLIVGFVRDISDQAVTHRRQAATNSLAQQMLRNAPLEDLGIAVAVLLREELAVDAVEIWRRADAEQSLELVASGGSLDDDPDEPPPLPEDATGPFAHPRGLGFAVVTPKGPTAAIALHCDPPPDLSVDDLSFVESVCQILVASISHHATIDRLELAERGYRELVERLPVVSYLAEYGPGGQWDYVSPQLEQLLGYTTEEWLTDNELWWNRVHPDDRARVEVEEKYCVDTLEPLSIEYRMLTRDGEVIWVRDEGAYGRPRSGGRVQVEGVLLDITERRHAEEELRHRAEHDELTGLANRRRFTDELRHRRLVPGARGALVIIDVDDLKFVNDSLGHAAGDALLRSVAISLRDALRPGEFLARFGGDEFTVFFDCHTEDAVRGRLAALLRAVRGGQSQVTARASAGAVLFDADTGSTDEDLLVAADIALHEAKGRGGDRYELFTGEESERLAWVGQLREAIDNDRLMLYEQPIVALRGDEAFGAEMLVRMVEADSSVLPPGAFLPTAERFGLIREIDRWVIDRAVAVAAAGRMVAINLSARSISDPGLGGHIRYALERCGADPAKVVFEITETAAATAGEDLRAFGARIERLGCSLAIDDFGTGFGSLTYLKHLPVRFLKIDMEFVQGLCESAADRAIVQSIVTIANSLGMRTIGEGVEDQATLDQLRELGVDYAQGYHLGRPALIHG